VNILFLTDNFPPEVNAPASRTFEHCREWVRAGHTVTVITCAPNFPTGKVAPGYANRLWQCEAMDGIRVVRLWTYIAANEGLVRRTLDYASFMIAALMAAPFLGRADVVVATSPHIFTACAGWAVAAIKRAPFVFELRDLWPDSIRAVGAIRNARVLSWLERLELFLYRRAAAIVAVTRSFRDNLVARGIDPRKISIVTNGADLARFRPQARDRALAERLGLNGRFVVGYVGTHGLAHGLEVILEAARRLAQRPEAGDVGFLLLGNGAAKKGLMQRAAELGLDNVLFVDSVAKAEVPLYWSLLDASVIHLQRAELFRTVIPSKLFETMAMGIPVLHGVEGESAELVRAHDAGLLFRPEDAGALAEAILALRRDPALKARLGRNGAQAARRFDRKALAAEMLAVLERLVEERPIAAGASSTVEPRSGRPLVGRVGKGATRLCPRAAVRVGSGFAVAHPTLPHPAASARSPSRLRRACRPVPSCAIPCS
jgi:glycosyltransferase involved in cell wall biosynthesis